MSDGETWRWKFLGFESAQEGRPVKEWFDGLPDNDKNEIRDLLAYMQNTKDRLWKKPEFDPLEGEVGISEIRIPDIRSSKGSVTYRIYGYFGPNKREYTFLHGTDKRVRNDRHGKGIAKRRHQQLECGNAAVHEFDFEN